MSVCCLLRSTAAVNLAKTSWLIWVALGPSLLADKTTSISSLSTSMLAWVSNCVSTSPPWASDKPSKDEHTKVLKKRSKATQKNL
ncbi:MAG: hypothetical protein EBQ68_09570 [Betaproteobacteria bacterium]|nr:hypothetical protein [Betaproteobacteria bacterium]